jgi:hypothetical protein
MIEKEDDKNYAYLAAHLKTLESAKEILHALEKQGIEAIILKGLHLAVKIYDELNRQPGSDIDLLLKRADIFRAEPILNELGWRPRAPVLRDLADGNKPCALNSLMFFRPDSLVVLHLHWHIINSTWPLNNYAKSINMEEIWQAATAGTLDGAPIRELKPEHLIIYLCCHGLIHYFAKPVYVDDIKTALVRFKDKINWDFLYGQAQEWGVRWIVDYCIKYIEKPRIGRYTKTYWRYFFHEKGITGKMLFLYRTFFPKKIVMAAAHNLPLAQIGFKLYMDRLENISR